MDNDYEGGIIGIGDELMVERRVGGSKITGCESLLSIELIFHQAMAGYANSSPHVHIRCRGLSSDPG